MATSTLSTLKRTVRAYYKKEKRDHLPWRRKQTSYAVLVSEIMLQQTQVDRVIPKFKAFIKRFPTVSSLARTSLGDVLREWQGLGYNRRAKMLHQAAQVIERDFKGRIPREYEALRSLPGVGEYTAKAVRVFAFNKPEVLIETNVRTVFIHHCFPKEETVADKKLIPLIQEALDTKNPREWYAALMDYGTHLKKTVGNVSRKSAQYVKQKPFRGSSREVRGAIIKRLAGGKASRTSLYKLPFASERIAKEVDTLLKEGLVVAERRSLKLP